jgi:hypothetical protein
VTSKAAIKRRKAASTAARAEENRLARERAGRTPSTPIAQPKERKGLEWLLHKKRITPKQFWAGTEYGNLYRAVAANGLEPLRSCINDERGGEGERAARSPA